jgi:hypothetical protein
MISKRFITSLTTWGSEKPLYRLIFMSNARSLPESRAPFTSDLHFKNVNQFTSENTIFTIFTTVKDKAVKILQKVIKVVDLYISNVPLFAFTVVNIQGSRQKTIGV